MSQNKRSLFSRIFIAMMIYCGLVWVWTVAFIIAWPWDKGGAWKPEFRLAAVCANGEACSLPYGKLADARAGSPPVALQSAADNGEIMEPDFWVRWKKTAAQPAQFETTASSWYFQTTVRYRLDGETPVLIESQEVNAKALYYGMAAAFFSLIGIYLRKLRG